MHAYNSRIVVQVQSDKRERSHLKNKLKAKGLGTWLKWQSKFGALSLIPSTGKIHTLQSITCNRSLGLKFVFTFLKRICIPLLAHTIERRHCVNLTPNEIDKYL
jgi:hypothetical protein